MAGFGVTYNTVSTLSKAYKRSTTKLYRSYTRRVPEYRWLDEIDDEEIIPSGRENLIPLDTAIGYGAHQADDGGYEGRTDSPAPTEGAFTFNHTNAGSRSRCARRRWIRRLVGTTSSARSSGSR
jgi:hypothetical protein